MKKSEFLFHVLSIRFAEQFSKTRFQYFKFDAPLNVGSSLPYTSCPRCLRHIPIQPLDLAPPGLEDGELTQR